MMRLLPNARYAKMMEVAEQRIVQDFCSQGSPPGSKSAFNDTYYLYDTCTYTRANTHTHTATAFVCARYSPLQCMEQKKGVCMCLGANHCLAHCLLFMYVHLQASKKK
uniref:Uncharacterized protein n=1 Tax=Dunaliella tertiolecta TaxID=3047 RepID=A0A7S3QU33_DUNTE